MNEPQKIEIVSHEDGTWTVMQNGKAAAKLVICPTGQATGSLSIDVCPVIHSTVQAIVFGAEPEPPDGGRQDRLRFTTERPDGRLRKGAMPFVCTDLTPKGGRS